MKSKIIFILTLTFVLSSLTALIVLRNKKDTKILGDKVAVSTSFYPVYFFTSVIGGDKVSITNIVPSGVEPHDFDPSAKDIANIEKSRLLVINGVIEPWATNIKDNLSDTVVVTAGEELMSLSTDDEDGETISDPHVWLSPVLAKNQVQKIYEGLIEADPLNTRYYSDNKDRLLVKLSDLDTEYRESLKQCDRRDIITSHTAFGYLAKEYGLNQVAISGLSPEEEPSAKQMIEIVNFAKEKSIKYIFFESLANPKISQTIATEAGVKTMVLDPIEGVSVEDSADGKDYFSIMNDNLNSLKEALGCQ